MTRGDRWKRRPCVMRYWAWKDLAKKCVEEQIGALPDAKQIRCFDMLAIFEPPKTKQSRIGELHRQRPDLDNVAKCAFDSLFSEDCAIAKAVLEKRWGSQARLEITIELEPEAAEEPRKRRRKQGV